MFRLDSEPLTPAPAAIFEQTGCRAANSYATSEAGWIGIPCARSAAVDEVHRLSDKMTLVQRDVASAPGQTLRANFYTTLLPTTPKLMIDVDCGDYSAPTRRSCGCPPDGLGYGVHLHTVCSYDKLTCAGVNFLGSELHRLVEEILPRRFGGMPMDYQLVEQDEGGLPKVDLLVSPGVGRITEAEVVEAVVGFLNAAPNASGDFGNRWRDARALRVVRREPFTTGAGKMLALHVLQQEAAQVVRNEDGAIQKPLLPTCASLRRQVHVPLILVVGRWWKGWMGSRSGIDGSMFVGARNSPESRPHAWRHGVHPRVSGSTLATGHRSCWYS